MLPSFLAGSQQRMRELESGDFLKENHRWSIGVIPILIPCISRTDRKFSGGPTTQKAVRLRSCSCTEEGKCSFFFPKKRRVSLQKKTRKKNGVDTQDDSKGPLQRPTPRTPSSSVGGLRIGGFVALRFPGVQEKFEEQDEAKNFSPE